MTMDQPRLIDLASDAPLVRLFLNIEYGEIQQPLEHAYRVLHLGDADGAVAAGASLDAVDAACLLRLAAASDGASAQLVQRALRLPHDESLNPTTVFAFAGLLLRENQGVKDLPDLVGMAAPQHAEAMSQVVAAIQARDLRRVDEVLEIAEPAVRGQFYTLATVALGDETPNHWREGARRLLFATERPYFVTSGRTTVTQ